MPSMADIVSPRGAVGDNEIGITAGIYRGYFAATPASEDDAAFVVIPAIDENMSHGPAAWSGRDGAAQLTPVAGDVCVIVVDDEGEPWVAQWWPGSEVV